MFTMQPDYEHVRERYRAWWQGEIVDRPPVSITLPIDKRFQLPQKDYPDLKARWLDVDFRAEQLALSLENTRFLGDALPIAWPNLGPEVFSAICGCPYSFGEDTTWSEPVIEDWADTGSFNTPDFQHPYFKALIRFTDALLSLSNGRFIVGLTDLHGGGDHLAALRDPQNLALDMIDDPEGVKKALDDSYPGFFRFYEFFEKKLFDAGMPLSTWTPVLSEERFYIPSNDFSCMISTKMFEEIFLPGIIEECNYFKNTLYHLDGPGALRHLDLLLDIPKLKAVQWVCGAGNEGYAKWVDVYRRIQKAGKSIQMRCHVKELDMIFETLAPEGVWFSEIEGISDEETASAVIRRIAAWK